jgi:hypothetical protein
MASAVFTEFEDGMENEVTLRIMRLLTQYGPSAVDKFARILSSGSARPEIVAQVLLCFGRTDDQATYSARSRAVREGLRSSSAKVRDAAGVAIDSMLDRSAEADLLVAIERERVPTLKQDMLSVLADLQSLK